MAGALAVRAAEALSEVAAVAVLEEAAVSVGAAVGKSVGAEVGVEAPESVAVRAAEALSEVAALPDGGADAVAVPDADAAGRRVLEALTLTLAQGEAVPAAGVAEGSGLRLLVGEGGDEAEAE